MKQLTRIISILSTLSITSAQGQSVQAVLVSTTIEPATSQASTIQQHDTVAPKGNFSCNYYSFDLSLKLFNSSDDVEDFLAKNTQAECSWRRNNGNLEADYRQFGEFRRVEIKNSTILRMPAKLFTNFSRLVVFRARSVELQEIRASGDFEGADFLQLLDVSGNKIKSLASQQFATLKSIKEIDLSNNQIEAIDDGAFDLMGANLTRVDLSGNKIKSFKEDFFLNMIVNVSRKWLPFDINLKNNELEKIEPSQRDAIIMPEVNLELSGNKLKSLELLKIEIFEIKLNNHSLESINVNASFINADNNKLTKLRIKGKTRMLSVRNNQITEVTYDDHLSLLRTFLISGNKLTADTVADFAQKIVNVEVLDISNNSLNSLKVDTFSELTRLESLSLSNVSLSEIAFGLFAYQRSLKYLDISYNNLSDIDLHIFSSAQNLEILDLSGTNASMVVGCRKIRDVLPRLKSIGLEDSNWICENLSRMKICLNSKGITIMDPAIPVKKESSIAGIKCVSNSDLMKNTTTSTTVATTVESTTNTVSEKLNEMMNKVNQLSEKVHGGNHESSGGTSSKISSMELGLSITLAIAVTLFLIYGVIKVKNYYKRNRFHMPFSGRGSPDTVITYEGSLVR